MDALRRFLLPCLRHTTTASPSGSASPPPPPAASNKKRLSSSLRDDLDDNNSCYRDEPHSSSSSTSSLSTSPTTTILPARSSRTMVIGTIFGHRRGGGGHVWFCIQQDRLSSKPSLLLELSIPISTLIHEMQCGLVRIALESNSYESGLATCPLRSIPLWTLYCNGRKLGFAVRRKATHQNKAMLKTMRSITIGAGVIPGSGGQEETMYIRANYECVLGNADSESFHLINPDEEGPGQELSIFLMRSR